MRNTIRITALVVLTVIVGGGIVAPGRLIRSRLAASEVHAQCGPQGCPPRPPARIPSNMSGYKVTYYQAPGRNIPSYSKAARNEAKLRGATVSTKEKTEWPKEAAWQPNPRQEGGFFELEKPDGTKSIVDTKTGVEKDMSDWFKDPAGKMPDTREPGSGQQEQPDTPEKPGEVCVVIAAGWSAVDENNKVVDGKDGGPSRPDGEKEYGKCQREYDQDGPGDIPDCPFVAIFDEFDNKKPDDLNYKLWHGTGKAKGSEVSLGENVRTAQEKHGTEEHFVYWIPDKEDAKNFVKNDFKYYDIDGQKVSPGPKQTKDRSVKDNDSGDTYAVDIRGGDCRFTDPRPEPTAPPPGAPIDPGLGGPGGNGGGSGGEEDSIMDWLLPLLMSLLEALKNGEGGGEPEREPSPSPTPDLEEDEEEPSPLTDEETLEIIDTELERLSDLGLSEEILDKVAQVVMDIIFRVFYGEFELLEVFAP